MEESVFEDVLTGALSGFSPYVMPLIFLAAAITFRVRLAEIAAEAVYVFLRKFDHLRGGRMAASAHFQALKQVWRGICLWKKQHRTHWGICEQAMSEMNTAGAELITTLELGLPYYDDTTRSFAEEIMRECIREQQIWQGAKDKSEAFLRDYQSAQDKIENKIAMRLMPSLQKILNA